MSKRASNENTFDFIVKKLAKLEKEIKRTRRNNSSTSSSSASSNSSSDSEIEIEDSTCQRVLPIPETSDPTADGPSQILSPPCDNYCIDVTSGDAAENNAVDITDILGNDPSISVEYGPDINKEVASRFNHIATSGVGKETRREMLKKYIIPANCNYISAPLLNPEIKNSAHYEHALKRDVAIENRQKLIAAGLAGLGQIISTQLASSEVDKNLVKDLMDVSRIFCDVQYCNSETRKQFILNLVKSDLRSHLTETKIDKFLFGSNFTESIKNAKAVSKSSLELKAQVRNNKSANLTNTARNLNWKARTSNRRQPGPAPRQQMPAAQSGTSRPGPSRNFSQRTKANRHRHR